MKVNNHRIRIRFAVYKDTMIFSDTRLAQTRNNNLQ